MIIPKKKIAKVRKTICFDEDVFDKINEDRVQIPFSKYLNNLLRKTVLKGGKKRIKNEKK